MSSKVYQGQNLLDKALEVSGSIEAAFALALANNLSLTDTLTIGQDLALVTIQNEAAASIFSELNRPASALTLDEEQLISDEDCGIGCMKIESTFIVT